MRQSKQQRRAELKSALAERWIKEIKKQLPDGKKLKILDVGCGSGFFSILLAKEGHQVVGTDLTPEMVVNAKNTRHSINKKEDTFAGIGSPWLNA
mgnify:CR=1 FL=1